MTTRRRLLASLLALPLVASLAACGRTPDATPAEGFRVALLTPGPVSDAGWNAGAFEGLKAIERELGAKVSHVQVKTPSEFEEQFRAYAAGAPRSASGTASSSRTPRPASRRTIRAPSS